MNIKKKTNLKAIRAKNVWRGVVEWEECGRWARHRIAAEENVAGEGQRLNEAPLAELWAARGLPCLHSTVWNTFSMPFPLIVF